MARGGGGEPGSWTFIIEQIENTSHMEWTESCEANLMTRLTLYVSTGGRRLTDFRPRLCRAPIPAYAVSVAIVPPENIMVFRLVMVAEASSKDQFEGNFNFMDCALRMKIYWSKLESKIKNVIFRSLMLLFERIKFACFVHYFANNFVGLSVHLAILVYKSFRKTQIIKKN